MINWIHRLFHPHCELCKQEYFENQVCKSCEVYREQLMITNRTNKELLDHLFPSDNESIETRIPEPIIPKSIPWKVKQQMLEEEDRQLARVMKSTESTKPNGKIDPITEQTVEELESELGIRE